MQIFIDKKLVRNHVSIDSQKPVNLSWAAFLEYIETGPLFGKFPPFNEQNPLYSLIISILPLQAHEDFLIELYDQVFVECLTHTKAIPQIEHAFLMDRIQKKRGDDIFEHARRHYETYLREYPYEAIHDLTLYLAWDRVCFNLSKLMEEPSSNPVVQKNTHVLKNCLIESFQHIAAQGKTTPSFFRLMAALIAFYMRDENLETHSEEEWTTLCQQLGWINTVEDDSELADVPYVDLSFAQGQDAYRVLTLDSTEKANGLQTLMELTIRKLQVEEVNWKYAVNKMEFISLFSLEKPE